MTGKFHAVKIIFVCALVGTFGCVSQDGGDYTGKPPLKIRTHALVGTNECLYVMKGAVACFDWEGTVVWESPRLGGNSMIYLGDAFFATTNEESPEREGVALLDSAGKMLWRKETGFIAPAGIGASPELLAVGSTQDYKTGILWAFSRTGDVLWMYDHPVRIDQVAVAPDSSCVVFTDYENSINCVRDGVMTWSRNVGGVDPGWFRRTIAFAPDSSYLVYGSEKDEPQIVATTLEGDVLWSAPVNNYLRSVAISIDNLYIIAGSFEHVYKYTADGTCVWTTETGANIDYIVITPDYIALGSKGLPSAFVLLNKEGTVVWKVLSRDTIFAIAISPDGKYAAFSNRQSQLYIMSIPPDTES